MATIAVMPMHWASDLNASFALARKLRARGHRTPFLTLPDAEEKIREQGFEYAPILERVHPKGFEAAQAASQARDRPEEFRRFKDVLQETLKTFEDGELERATRGFAPELLLISSYLPWLGIAARQLALPIVSFSSSLISVPDPIVPPFRSARLPDASLRFRLETFWAWRRVLLRRRAMDLAWSLTGELRRFAGRVGFPAHEIDFRVETWPRLSYPEIVLCPREFDFPRRKPPQNVAFAEASVDLERKEQPPARARLDGDRPLVFCSLGTIVTFKYLARSKLLIQAFLDAVAARPHWQGIAAIGKFLSESDFRVPPNATVRAEVSQLSVLGQAALLVTHGGISGVKESLFFGVPMVVVPFFYDQPGNAARVVYHGLGIHLPAREVSAANLGASMERVLAEPSFRAGVTRMSAVFREREAQAPSVQIVERALHAGGPVPSPSGSV